MGLKCRFGKAGKLLSLSMWLLSATASNLNAQVPDRIWSATEPNSASVKTKATLLYQQSAMNSVAFSGLSNGLAVTTLPGFKRSNVLLISGWNLNIPQGAIIKGIKVKLEGYTEGQGFISEVANRWIKKDGRRSADRSNQGYPEKEAWAKDTVSHFWKYGSSFDNWGNILTYEDINDPNFTLELQFRNIVTQSITATIQSAEVEVFYQELPTFCADGCPIFYVDHMAGVNGYDWKIPQGFMLTSKSEKHIIVDLKALNGTPSGVYQICVDLLKDNVFINQLCKDFRHVNCVPGSIGDRVWNDFNQNGVQDANESGIPNVKVSLFNNSGQSIATVQTNGAGNYNFNSVEPGTYYVAFDLPASFAFTKSLINDPNQDSNVNEANGPETTSKFFIDYNQNITNIDAGMVQLSDINGQVWEDNNGDGQFQSGEPLLSLCKVYLLDSQEAVIDSTLTDALGKYRFDMLPLGNYIINIPSKTGFNPMLLSSGTQTNNNDITVPPNMTTLLTLTATGLNQIDGGYYKPAVIEGIAWLDTNCNGAYDVGEPLLSNSSISLSNDMGVLTTASTDIDGKYAFTNLIPASYFVIYEDGVDPLTSTVLGQNKLFNENNNLRTEQIFLNSGGTQVTDLGLIMLRTKVCGVLWFDANFDGVRAPNEQGGAPVEVSIKSINGDPIQTISATDSFCFEAILPGSYIIEADLDSQRIFTTLDVDDDTTDNDADANGTILIDVASGKPLENLGIGYGFKPSLGGKLWFDIDNDGLYTVPDTTIRGVTVYLHNTDGTVLDSMITSQEGSYAFDYIQPGSYYLSTNIGAAFKPILDSGLDDAIDSDYDTVNGPLATPFFTVTANMNNFNYFFGHTANFGSICGQVWEDLNDNGQRDESTTNIVPVKLVMINSLGDTIQSIVTADSYCFDDLEPGSYNLHAMLASNCQFALSNTGPDETDSDFDHTTGSTAIIGVTSGQTIIQTDLGFNKMGCVGDYIWWDENRNGLQDQDEMGIANVTINLFNQNGTLAGTTQSKDDGSYLIDQIVRGPYYLQFEELEDYDFTMVQPNTTLGSTAGFNGISQNFNVKAYASLKNFDAGYVLETGSISGSAWEDMNRDGILDANEAVIPNILVTLYNGTTLFATTSTDNSGNYRFDDLVNGNYTVVFDTIAFATYTQSGQGGNSLLDSDVTSSISIGSTDVITIAGSEIAGVNAGYIISTSGISGIVWTDKWYDGEFGTNDEINAGVWVYLFEDGILSDSTTTDSAGIYTFTAMNPNSTYQLAFQVSAECFAPTVKGKTTTNIIGSEIDSTSLGFGSLPFMITIDQDTFIHAGFIGYSTLSGRIFIDSNEDGVEDQSEIGREGLVILLQDLVGNTIESTMTNVNGNYYFDFSKRIVPDTYHLSFVKPQFYQPTISSANTSDSVDNDFIIVTGANVTTDSIFVCSKSTLNELDGGLIFRQEFNSSIGGVIWLDTIIDGIRSGIEPLVDSGTVYLIDGTTNELLDSVMLVNGAYLFDNLSEGNYIIRYAYDSILINTFFRSHADTLLDSDFHLLAAGYEASILLGPNENITHIDLGLSKAITWNGIIWEDTSYDGQRDDAEPLYENAVISLIATINNYEFLEKSSFTGSYTFRVPATTYIANITEIEGFSLTKPNLGSESTDSDFNLDGFAGPFGEMDITVDGGIVRNGTIGDRVWVDFNGNGRQDMGEPGIAGIRVELYAADGTFIDADSTVIDSDLSKSGKYLFENVKPDNYYVVFKKPNEYLYVPANIGNADQNSDVTNSIVIGSTDEFELFPGEQLLDLDAGIYLPSGLGDFVWDDLNGDGLQDTGEPGIEGVEVTLRRSNGEFIATVLSDNSGQYFFSGLRAGLYTITFGQLSGYEYTIADQDGDDILDSDVISPSGMTPLISLAHGVNFINSDCGFKKITEPTELPNTTSQVTNNTGNYRINPEPNPALYETNLEVLEDGIYNLEVFNNNGNIVDQKELLSIGGVVSWDVSSLESGIYNFTLTNGRCNYYGRLIKVF